MEEHSIHDALIEGIVVGDDDLMERYLADEAIPTAELAHDARRRCRVGRGVPGPVRQRDQAHRRRPAGVVHHRGGPRAQARGGRRSTGRVRVQDHRRPVRRPREPVQGAAGHGEDRRHAGERPHHARRAAASAVGDPRQGAGGDLRGAGGRHRRRRQARRHDHRRRARRRKGAEVDVEPFEPPAPVLAIAIRAKSKSDEDKLANALHRLLDEDPALRLERNAETHQTLLWGQGETHLGDRAGTPAPQARRRGRDRRGEGRLPGDHHPRGRGRGQVQEADRRSRPVRGRVRAGRTPRARRRLRVRRPDRGGRHPPPVHPRGGEGRPRDDGAGRRATATPSST